MSRSSFTAEVDARLERDIEREPTYAPGKPGRRGLVGRYRFMVSWQCTGCGGCNQCTCEDQQ